MTTNIFLFYFTPHHECLLSTLKFPPIGQFSSYCIHHSGSKASALTFSFTSRSLCTRNLVSASRHDVEGSDQRTSAIADDLGHKRLSREVESACSVQKVASAPSTKCFLSPGRFIVYKTVFKSRGLIERVRDWGKRNFVFLSKFVDIHFINDICAVLRDDIFSHFS